MGRLARIEEGLAAQSRRGHELLSRAALVSGALVREQPTIPGGASQELVDDWESALQLCRASVAAVDQPLVLISQAQRSGGTLLARLFDGHPQCHVHPHELHVGDRRRHTWPDLQVSGEPELWFAKLEERALGTLFRTGRRRIPLKAQAPKPGEVHYPFMLPPELQRQVFLDEVERRSPITSERAIFDCYMTSLFNAWLDNQNLRGADKRRVIAFSPRRAHREGLAKFFEIYPDGRLISILRDPLSWYTSARGRAPAAETSALLGTWKNSARELLAASRRFEDLVYIVRFEELVNDTKASMQCLADFLGIAYDPQLTTPTFNRYPTGPNSSYDMDAIGVVSDPVDRHERVLSSEDRELVRTECEELYDQFVGLRAAAGARGRESKVRSRANVADASAV